MLLASSAMAGCAPAIGGLASFPLLSKGTLPNSYRPVAQVDESRCVQSVLFLFAWGEDSNHEAIVTDLLQRHQADAIVDAELTFTSVPAFVYTRDCARVTGTVVRRVARAQPLSAPEPAQAGGVQ